MSPKFVPALALLSLGCATIAVPSQPAHAQTPQATSQKPVLTTLHRFNKAYGSIPRGLMTQGTDGAFYGATVYGGIVDAANKYGYGTLFQMTPEGRFTTLFAFNGKNGNIPNAPLVQGADGAWYGTTEQGGGYGNGTLFRLNTDGSVNTLFHFHKLFHRSENKDGAYPEGGLTLGPDGTLYGATFLGGRYGLGTIFQWTETGGLVTLHDFAGADGALPAAAPVFGPDGALYGTTERGGVGDNVTMRGGYGALYRITTQGEFLRLHALDYYHDGYQLLVGLAAGTDGLYGVTINGGKGGYGTMFRVTPSGQFTVIHAFSNDGHGVFPLSALTSDGSGGFYGTLQEGGAYNPQQSLTGAIYHLAADGSVSTLYKFHADAHGKYPHGMISSGVMLGADGLLYGTTGDGGLDANHGAGYGTIFKLTPPQ